LQDKEFMQLALDEARLAFDAGEIPVGAVAVYRGKVVGRGHNRKENDRDPTAHAEIIALRQAASARNGWRLLDTTLYCTMEPCPMCAGAMVQARLPTLVFGVVDPKAGAAGSVVNLLQHPMLNHTVAVRSGILEVEIQGLLATFFEGLRNGTLPRFSNEWRRSQLAKSGK
jgi:tRNA(adenine34) deaminase